MRIKNIKQFDKDKSIVFSKEMKMAIILEWYWVIYLLIAL